MELAERISPESRLQTQKRKVLIIDDDPTIVDFIKLILVRDR